MKRANPGAKITQPIDEIHCGRTPSLRTAGTAYVASYTYKPIDFRSAVAETSLLSLCRWRGEGVRTAFFGPRSLGRT
jgi:hypothetical protein